MGVNKCSLGNSQGSKRYANARPPCGEGQGEHRPPRQAGSASERSPELVFVTVLEWPRVSQMSGKNSKVICRWMCLTACLLTAHGSEAPPAVCVDTGKSLDSPIMKFLSQLTLLPSTQAVSKAGNGSRNQSDGSEAGDCLLPKSSSEAAFRS